jgi:hypothetical protein
MKIWFLERFDYWVGLARCRLLRRHGPGCRGRTDHIGPDGLGIIDPDRWTH